MYAILLVFITGFIITYLAIPSIIHIARAKKIYDAPNERSSHTDIVPRLGGIGIFAGVLFSIILWVPFWAFGDLQYILCSFIIIFLIGAKDDIISISPIKKFVAQGLAAFILVYKSGVRVSHLHGFLGIEALPEQAGFFLSIFAIVAIINAFNLIDGINGLAGSLGLLTASAFGAWFFAVNQNHLALVAFALAGSLTAFLKFNLASKARIFMGDTGSMLVGIVCATLGIKFLEVNGAAEPSLFRFSAAIPIAAALLALPLFDTAQVFLKRLMKGRSPFYPDKTHIHHMALDCGLSHLQTTALLVSFNVLLVGVAIFFQKMSSERLFLLELVILAVAFFALRALSERHRRQLADMT